MPTEIDTLFQRVFEGHHEGVKVLEHLLVRFKRNPWVRGGHEAERETNRRFGNTEVVDYIIARINRANGVNEHVEDEPTET